MKREMKQIKKNGLSASVVRQGDQYLYNVWHPIKGMVAGGFRKTEGEAIKAATLVLKSKPKRTLGIR